MAIPASAGVGITLGDIWQQVLATLIRVDLPVAGVIPDADIMDIRIAPIIFKL